MTSVPSTLGIVASGEDVLNDAVFWVDAGRSSVVSGALSNLGTGGSALNAVFGNSTGVDSFDPALLTHTGTNYVYMTGLTNYAATPSATPLDITGDIEIVVRLAADDWTPTAPQIIASKRSSTNLSWQLQLAIDGTITWSFNNGTNLFLNGVVTAPSPLTDGVPYWLKFTRVASTGAIAMQQASDQATEPTSWPTTWTSSGTRNTGNITAQAVELAIGAARQGSAGDSFVGKFYRAIVRNGIGGTTVFDADFTTGITSGAQTTFTESSANAATVTINRSTSGRKAVAVTRPILLFGTDDYLEVPDNDLLDFGVSDSFTMLLVHRAWATFATSAAGVAKKANATATTQGWLLSAGSTTAAQGQMQVGDGTNGTTAVSGSRTSGALSIVTAVRNVTADTVQTFLGNTGGTAITDATTTTSANAEVMRIGRLSGAGTGYSDFEVLAAAVWRRALNANEIATIVARYS